MHNKFKHGSFEGATVYNRFAVKLGGAELLKEHNDEYLEYSSEETLISNVIGYDYRFLYLIEEISEGSVTRYERGIGYISTVDDNTLLQRDTPLAHGDLGDHNLYKVGQQPITFSSGSTSYLRVYSVTPENLSEALATPFSVITSVESRQLFPVVLEESTVLGRVHDEVQPMGKDELKDIIEFDDSALSALESTQKQMTLKVRRLDLSRKNAFVSAPYIRLMPDCYTSSQRPPSQQGAIIYNTETHSLEFYDGESWKTLTHSDSGDK